MSLTPKQVVYGTIQESGQAVLLHDGTMIHLSEKNMAVGSAVYVMIETVGKQTSGKILNFI